MICCLFAETISCKLFVSLKYPSDNERIVVARSTISLLVNLDIFSLENCFSKSIWRAVSSCLFISDSNLILLLLVLSLFFLTSSVSSIILNLLKLRGNLPIVLFVYISLIVFFSFDYSYILYEHLYVQPF